MGQVKRLIPNRLHIHRRQLEYKQKHVAHLIGLKNPAELCRWEKGTMLPNADNLLKLCILYRTTPQELYGEYMNSLRQDIFNKEIRLDRDS